jgi:predicted signal transduction protein with EAL and GGDEF domain
MMLGFAALTDVWRVDNGNLALRDSGATDGAAAVVGGVLPGAGHPSGLGDRDRLIRDLESALEPGSAPTVLAVFGLVGLTDYRRVHGDAAGDELVDRLGRRFVLAAGATSRCYRSRRDELCVLVGAGVGDVLELFGTVADELGHEGASAAVGAVFGAASLPDEAPDPIGVLMLADERLRLRAGGQLPPRRVRPREVGPAI